MKHFLLIYELADDYLERRADFREEHLRLAWAAHDNGDLVLGGAVNEPTDTAYLLFSGSGPQAAMAFAEADPYVVHGLVRSWRVREWRTVVGALASDPVPVRSS